MPAKDASLRGKNHRNNPGQPSNIYFFKADVAFRFQGKSKIPNWIKKVVRQEGGKLASLNIVFCSDKSLLNINRQFLRHDYFTDIITFDYPGDGITGEIYISTDRVLENSKSLNVPFEQELRRVIIHGVLHLLGYKDKTASQKRAIRKKEDDCLVLFR